MVVGSFIDWEAFTIASVFVREAIFRSYKRSGRENRFMKFLLDVFMPRATDDVLTYNMKWFVAGLFSGLFMAIWIPLFVLSSRYLGLMYTAELLLISYLTMAFIIAVIIVFDLIHQVTASIRELKLWTVLERHPVPRSVLEKASSYSVLIGGGISLLFGIGLAIGVITYIVTDNLGAILYVPMGFLASIMLIYPVALVLIDKIGSSLSNLVSLIIYVLLVAVAMSLYVVFIGLASPAEVYLTIYSYRVVYPLPYVYVSVLGNDASAALSSLSYFLLGLVLSATIPSRVGIKLLEARTGRGKKRVLKYPRLWSMAFKDVFILLRDRARSKQFYGQIAALITPAAIPLFTPKILYIISVTEYMHVVFIFTIYGLLSYILAVIASPVLLFSEAENSLILKRLPLTINDVALSKLLASLILYQPFPLLLASLVTYMLRDPLIGLIVYYSLNAYWVLGGIITLYLVLLGLWRSSTAWTELSLGIIKRLIVTLVAVSPLLIYVPIVMFMYFVDITTAITVMLITPAPLLAGVLLYSFAVDRV